MIVIMVLVILSIAISVAFAINEPWDKLSVFFAALFICAVFSMAIITIVSFIGHEQTKVTTQNTFTQKLATLNDGTGVKGEFYGGLFLQRGEVNDTQHYSYYVQNENGSFNLNKRPAQQSTIWQDATPETARVDITDNIITCKSTWWFSCSLLPLTYNKPVVEFSHANFHVPENSISNQYELDAK